LIKRGQVPTVASVEKQCESILSRQHLNQVITIDIREGKEKIPDKLIDALGLKEEQNVLLG
jgi:hypothetical protein